MISSGLLDSVSKLSVLVMVLYVYGVMCIGCVGCECIMVSCLSIWVGLMSVVISNW